ncbi:hypothetical protein FRC08_011599, partial [Ceratobasidium sp. 394]
MSTKRKLTAGAQTRQASGSGHTSGQVSVVIPRASSYQEFFLRMGLKTEEEEGTKKKRRLENIESEGGEQEMGDSAGGTSKPGEGFDDESLPDTCATLESQGRNLMEKRRTTEAYEQPPGPIPANP